MTHRMLTHARGRLFTPGTRPERFAEGPGAAVKAPSRCEHSRCDRGATAPVLVSVLEDLRAAGQANYLPYRAVPNACV
jgi:hypothetical protein